MALPGRRSPWALPSSTGLSRLSTATGLREAAVRVTVARLRPGAADLRRHVVTSPQDPFATPADGGASGEPGQRTGAGQSPGYGQPPWHGSSPGPSPSYGAPPAYGSSPYGAQPYGAPGSGAAAGRDRPPLAGWGLRAGGFVIDSVISGVVVLVVGLVSADLANLVNLLVFLGFGFLTGTTGQTPGRRLVGISVVREADGTHLGAVAGIGRSFLHILDALPLGLGYLWPIWDRKKQTFADKIISSVVIKV